MTLNEEIPHPVLRAFREEEDVEKEELPLLFSMSIIVVYRGVGVTRVLWFLILLKVPYFWWINSGSIFYMSKGFFGQTTAENLFYVHEKLQRNSSVGSCLEYFIFWPYRFDYLGFLTNAHSRRHWRSTPFVLNKKILQYLGLKSADSNWERFWIKGYDCAHTVVRQLLGPKIIQ